MLQNMLAGLQHPASCTTFSQSGLQFSLHGVTAARSPDGPVTGPDGPDGPDGPVTGPDGPDGPVPGPDGPDGPDGPVPGPDGPDGPVPGPDAASSWVNVSRLDDCSVL